mmetsp:Transcript_58355/g.161367  ORF Transcript_58355/g.161367 Transcript_58355/m.161367 type:complete len:256 (+) Transcript_58355:320-1087(+)
MHYRDRLRHVADHHRVHRGRVHRRGAGHHGGVAELSLPDLSVVGPEVHGDEAAPCGLRGQLRAPAERPRTHLCLEPHRCTAPAATCQSLEHTCRGGVLRAPLPGDPPFRRRPGPRPDTSLHGLGCEHIHHCGELHSSGRGLPPGLPGGLPGDGGFRQAGQVPRLGKDSYGQGRRKMRHMPPGLRSPRQRCPPALQPHIPHGVRRQVDEPWPRLPLPVRPPELQLRLCLTIWGAGCRRRVLRPPRSWRVRAAPPAT